MILKCFVLIEALQVITCISLANDFCPNGKSPINQRKCPINSDLVGLVPGLPVTNIADTDNEKITNVYENWFPEVTYPTCILDIAEPFYYIANGYDDVLGPFDDDVKYSYKCISSNNKKPKSNNFAKTYEDEKSKCIPITTSSINNKNNNTNEQSDKKPFTYNEEEFKETCIYQQNNDSIYSEETININESNETRTYKDCELNDITLTSLYLSNNKESETDNTDTLSDNEYCDKIASTDYKNITSIICNSDNSDKINETKNYSVIEKTIITDDRQLRIRVQINVDVSKVTGQHNDNSTIEKLSIILPYKILEYISSEENETIVAEKEQFTNKNSSSEEINILPEDILKLLLNSSDTDLVLSELLTELLLLGSSEEFDDFYSILQLLNENDLNITRVESPLNETISNIPDSHDYIETLKIHVEYDKDSNIRDNDTTTVYVSTENPANGEDSDETDDGDFFLDFVVSLDSLCQMNDSTLSDNLSEAKQTYKAMYSNESSSEEDQANTYLWFENR